ncbi:DNA polymerase III subunit epsilon [uncultured Rhodoblastus sp.]|uniref:DNA polymerase III subunit epsilon n=1 Tax=uncultured Rhodoblastus sp. TaxID=543037 RepID=UPI0025D6C875|nr:DNA polymerase III subunit epsilon [uncultured Rhodoblastus sp.]
MREIILDTETTGLDPAGGDRIVEIAALELFNGSITQNRFHVYINPERDMPDSAFKVHGLSQEFLSDKPTFGLIVDSFVDFIASDPIVAHNAEFDVRFLNCELERLGRSPIDNGRVIDTLLLARRKHPGTSNSLDALCARYGIDRSRRSKHGAVIDSEILAEVYMELKGGRQTSLSFATGRDAPRLRPVTRLAPRRETWPSYLTDDEVERHQAFVEKKCCRSLWLHYAPAQNVPSA